MKRRVAVTGAALLTLRALRGFKVGDEVQVRAVDDGYAFYAEKRRALAARGWLPIREVVRERLWVDDGQKRWAGCGVDFENVVAWRPGKEKK